MIAIKGSPLNVVSRFIALSNQNGAASTAPIIPPKAPDRNTS